MSLKHVGTCHLASNISKKYMILGKYWLMNESSLAQTRQKDLTFFSFYKREWI